MLKLTPKAAQPAWENRGIEGRFQPAILDGDHLYVNSEGTLVCMKWPNNEIKWKTGNRDKNLLGLGGSIVRVGGDKMILLSQGGRLTLAQATPEGFSTISSIPDFVEGSEVWAAPAIHDGKLYVKGERELVCVNIRQRPYIRASPSQRPVRRLQFLLNNRTRLHASRLPD